MPTCETCGDTLLICDEHEPPKPFWLCTAIHGVKVCPCSAIVSKADAEELEALREVEKAGLLRLGYNQSAGVDAWRVEDILGRRGYAPTLSVALKAYKRAVNNFW